MFEDTKWAIKSRKSKKDRQYNDHNKKGLSMIHETLHWKLKIDQQEPPLPQQSRMNSGIIRNPCSTDGTLGVTLVPNIFAANT